jgi:hypothetical protein
MNLKEVYNDTLFPFFNELRLSFHKKKNLDVFIRIRTGEGYTNGVCRRVPDTVSVIVWIIPVSDDVISWASAIYVIPEVHRVFV